MADPRTAPADRASRGEITSWALYDFGSSAFNTIVVTFLFSRYFAETVVPAGEAVATVCTVGESRGTVLWTLAVSISAVLVAVMMPLLGAVADYSGRKKVFLVGFALSSVAATGVLFFVGLPGNIAVTFVVFVVANVAFEAGNVFYNAFLPEISGRETMGRISGLGFMLGYLGGLLCLAVALAMLLRLPGDAAGAYLNERAPLLLVAAWFLVFASPLFFVLRERAEKRRASPGAYLKIGFGRLADTVRHVRELKEAAKLLVARMIYNDGLVTVIAMAAIYTAVVLEISPEQFLVIAIALNVAAGLGAFAFGFVDDRIGGKRTLVITLLTLIAAGVIGVTWTSLVGFWIAATLIGVMMGPNQSASRSLFARLVPEHKHGEMFGLFAFSGKMSSLAGPLAYGAVVGATCDHRLAMATIILFFVAGLAILLLVREEEGIRLADRLNEEFDEGAGSTDG